MTGRILLAAATLLLAVALALVVLRRAAPGGAGGASAPVPLRERLAHAPALQALRCGWAPAPVLAGSEATLTYRHAGDEEPARDLVITLTSGGTLTVRPRDGTVTRRVLGVAAAQRFFATVDAEHLLCAATVPRYGARSASLARDTLEVDSAGQRRVLSVDRCHGLNDPLAFEDVSAALRALVPDGQGAAPARPADVVRGACDDALLAAVEARASASR